MAVVSHIVLVVIVHKQLQLASHVLLKYTYESSAGARCHSTHCSVIPSVNMSLISQISESERLFITHGVDINIRSDGRSCTDYRSILIEQNVIETCSGSAHARSGNTDVLVGIKLELEEVTDPAECTQGGRVQIFADISAIASPAFEGRKGEDITCQLEALFAEFLPNHLDLKKLIIVPNKSYFVLHVDIVILECSSFASLIDITSIAIKTALHDVK